MIGYLLISLYGLTREMYARCRDVHKNMQISAINYNIGQKSWRSKLARKLVMRLKFVSVKLSMYLNQIFVIVRVTLDLLGHLAGN